MVGATAAIWTVEALFQPVGLPQHTRLVDDTTGRQMTVAVSVLADPDRFIPVDLP
jgi:hypothetical protein